MKTKEIIFKMNHAYKLVKKSDECNGCYFAKSVLKNSEREDMYRICESSDICFVENGVWIKESE